MLEFVVTAVVLLILAPIVAVILTGLMIMGGVPVAIILGIIGMFRMNKN